MSHSHRQQARSGSSSMFWKISHASFFLRWYSSPELFTLFTFVTNFCAIYISPMDIETVTKFIHIKDDIIAIYYDGFTPLTVLRILALGLVEFFEMHQRRSNVTPVVSVRKSSNFSRIPVAKFRDVLSSEIRHEDCSICLESLSTSVCETSCKHQYHKECIETWSKSSSTCPLCRSGLYC